ncbi:uncharacterized protein si:ch211-276i12.4 [Betta splendens]|uniref:Uncharacterized protein si:ch211-276i12.4 n=1 Tax=Betta splendens TaxID=158456 RepID=A0A6P7NWK7_BETSP|nr:uncharacterized protein si:ch211-276i12.4 [Betta splendens]XP_029021920.1 uncharacterized protein si:ch211-276i12.4 [Betta splendens]XP_055368235.1 uncharacterized protein si:ch211-276i12.4 [Betta splendens]
MEKFFKPVHRPCAPDEIKLRKHHHHLHPYQEPKFYRYTTLDETDRNVDQNQRHQCSQQHRGSDHNGPHHTTYQRHQTPIHHSEESEVLYNHPTPVTLSAASSSSLSSSSSSFSSSSWYTEASANDPFSLRHAERPQHSLSCSNIADVPRGCREDENSEPIAFASNKHGKKDSVCSETHATMHPKGMHGFPSLDRGHSRSEEGLLQVNVSDREKEQSRAPRMKYGPLYKTASLNRGLEFSEQDALLGVSRGPKRAVSSSQLPSKGILKNKQPQIDIRKTKSMEVLSPRVLKEQAPSAEKGKGVSQAEVEQARVRFVQGKVQFSAFLDEITKQVISPSDLTILGLKNNETSGKTPGPVRPQLPPKKHRERSEEARELHPKQPSRQDKAAGSSSRKQSDCSNPESVISCAPRSNHTSPSPHRYPNSGSHSAHYGGSRRDRRPSPTGGSVTGDRYRRCGSHLTDDTSTSPERGQSKQRHHRKQQPALPHGTQAQRLPQYPPQQVPLGSGHRGPARSPSSGAPGAEPGLRSESSSSKSDSSRTRDTASTATSYSSSEQRGRHHYKQSRDTPSDAERLHALQEDNADLHQNLLQTVVCIESLEAELQRTRDELSHVKEKYNSLLESHTGTKQANNLLGEQLHVASESLSSERKHLLKQVSQLSSELEDAHRTIAALENINVPCLIKGLLEKHFDSAEAVQRFLSGSAPKSYSATSPQADGRSHPPEVGREAHGWLAKSEAGLQRATAFVPFKQGPPAPGSEPCLAEQRESCYSPPFSVADISSAICNNMADTAHPACPRSRQQPPPCADHAEPPLERRQGDSWGGTGGVMVSLLEQDVVDVTAMSAQKILDEFMQQLQAHKEVGGGKAQQGRQGLVRGAEQAGKVAQ